VPIVEILSIGTELTMGRIQDTNSQWIAGEVSRLGGIVRRIIVLRDCREEIIAAFRECVARKTNLIISTGGMGPTPDDMTVECVAFILDVPTIIHEPTLEDYMRRRNLKRRDQLTPNLLRMATVPAGAEIFPNPVGWAPCVSATLGECRIFVLPGPPHEVQALFSLYIAQHISRDSQPRCASQRVAVDMFESEVSPLMQEVMTRFAGVYLKAYVSLRPSPDHRLPIDIVATGESAAAAEAILDRAVRCFTHLVEERGKTVIVADSRFQIAKE